MTRVSKIEEAQRPVPVIDPVSEKLRPKTVAEAIAQAKAISDKIFERTTREHNFLRQS